MTGPGGGTSMDFGDDYVAARISVDVPTEGLSNVRELTEGIERFHTSMEAAVRSEADMSRYLEQMAESSKRAAEAQANVNQQLQTYIQLQGHSVGMATSSGVPTGGAINPFGGMSAGMGVERPPASSDVYWQLNQHAQSAPREYMNMQAARGGVPNSVSLDPGSVASLATAIAEREKAMNTQHRQTAPAGPAGSGPGRSHAAAPPNVFDQAQHRVGGAMNLGNSVLNELGASGGVGFGGLALQGMNFARHKLDAKAAGAKSGTDAADGGGEDTPDDGGTGGLSGLSKGLGIAGGAVGGLLGIFDLAQKAGGFVQGLRNTAGQRGGAAGEGAELQLKVRQMAMDPSISTDQARQVYQALLSEGYSDASGNGAEDKKDFLSNNIKNFNMDVSQSVELLRMSAKGTKISLGSLTDTLSELREASKTGFLSNTDRQTLVMNQMNQLITQGVDPAKALQQATQSSYSFEDNPILAGQMSGNSTQNMGSLERMYGGVKTPPGLRPNAINRYLSDTGQDEKGRYSVFYAYAQQAHRDNGDTTDSPSTNNEIGALDGALQEFNDLLNTPGTLAQDDPLRNPKNSDELYKQMIYGGQTPQKMVDQEKKSQLDATKGQRQTTEVNVGGQKMYQSQTLSRIVKAYGDGSKGIGAVEVIDEKGNVHPFDPTNKDQVDKLDNGTYRWRHKGDKNKKGILLSDTPEDLGSDYTTDRPGNPGKAKDGAATTSGRGGYDGNAPSNKNNGVQIALTDDAKKLLKLLNSDGQPYESPNDTAANSGQNGASKNNPPPGDSKFRTQWVPR